MNTAFVHAMRKRGWPIRFAAPFLLLAVLVLPLPKLVGFLVIASSTAMSLAILLISKRHFGGITGDVMGATNDLTRLASLLCIIVTKGWA